MQTENLGKPKNVAIAKSAEGKNQRELTLSDGTMFMRYCFVKYFAKFCRRSHSTLSTLFDAIGCRISLETIKRLIHRENIVIKIIY